MGAGGPGGPGASSERAGELLDRFGIAAYPTLLWFDGSKKWPFYASEAKPERYGGERTTGALTAFIEERTGIAPPQRAVRPAASEPAPAPRHAPPPPAEPPARSTPVHACTALAASYSDCMRHRRDRQHLCASERHEYVLCMSGRWSVHPDEHEQLAARYHEFAPPRA